MSFLGLVSDKAPKNMEEIARLNWIIQEMERMNVVLRDERDLAKSTAEGVLEFQKSRDKERNGFQKQISKLKMEVILEKKSSAGLTQKMGAMSIDLTLRKEERINMMEEQIFNRHRVKEMEKQLNDDRSKRLRNLHENELLRQKNVQLEARCTTAEAAAQKASKELLEKLQVLETTLELVASQKRTIEAQGAEMLELNREVTMQKEALRDVSDRCLKLERQIADRQKERDAYEQEAFRLRREIMQMGVKSSEKASAFSSFEPRSRQNSAASTMRPSTTMSVMSANGRARTPGGAMRGGSPSSTMMSSTGGSTFGTDSVFVRPELDNGAQLTPLATPGDRRPRTRHVSTVGPSTGVDTRTGSMSPMVTRPGTGGQPLHGRMRTAPNLGSGVDSRTRFEPEASELTEGTIGAGVQFVETDDYDDRANQTLTPLGVTAPRIDSPAPHTQSSPFLSPSTRSGRGAGTKNNKKLSLRQPPLSDLAASYMKNTMSPGTGLRSLDGSGKNGVGNTSIHATHILPRNENGSPGSSMGGTPKSLKKQHLTDRTKSNFVGMGLGLRQEPIEPYSAGGGPKAVLARILAESESMD